MIQMMKVWNVMDGQLDEERYGKINERMSSIM